MKCYPSRNTQCQPAFKHTLEVKGSLRDQVSLGVCVAGERMWWFRFLSPGHEMGHSLHLAVAAPAPGFSAGEDTNVTKLRSGVKLPLFPSAAWSALSAVILSRHANVIRLGVRVPQLPKMLCKSYILLILSNSTHFVEREHECRLRCSADTKTCKWSPHALINCLQKIWPKPVPDLVLESQK